MANTVYENKLIASKATDLLTTLVNARSLMTIDDSLEGAEGMTKTINTYTYSGTAEELAAGVGNSESARGKVTFVGKDYKINVVQQAFDYTDEDYMKDSNVVDFGIKGATQIMSNHLTSKFYDALATSASGAELVGKTTFAKGGSISYETIVDAIADMNVEDESKLVLLIPIKWKAAIRKDADYKTAQFGEVVYNGQVGTIAGIPVVATKAITDKAYVLSPEAVTLFVKKEVEVENDRDADKRTNSIYLREGYICALTDATKARKITEASV